MFTFRKVSLHYSDYFDEDCDEGLMSEEVILSSKHLELEQVSNLTNNNNLKFKGLLRDCL